METPTIDLVYCWVDGDHPQHQALRASYRPVDHSSAHITRFRSAGEIYASLESAWKFAPWLRTIFVVVDDIQVSRFDLSRVSNPHRVKVIPHSILFQKMPSHLPTFNSQAIETHLGDIPGLAELFLYANDDTFFGTHCHWSQFFFNNYPKIALTTERLRSEVVPGMATHFHSRVNNSKLLNTLQGRVSTRYSVHHQVRPLCKQLYREAWAHPLLFSPLVYTSASRFRSSSDIETVGLLLHWGYQQGKVMLASDIKSKYVGVTHKTDLAVLSSDLCLGKYHLYCLNDVMLNCSPIRSLCFRNFLETMLPSSSGVRHVPVVIPHHVPVATPMAIPPVIPLHVPASRPKRRSHAKTEATKIAQALAKATLARMASAKRPPVKKRKKPPTKILTVRDVKMLLARIKH